MLKKTIAILFIFLGSHVVIASDSTVIKPVIPKKTFLLGSEIIVYSISYAGLYSVWYADYPKSGFHLFNDMNQWQQLDKCGHSYSTYWLGRLNNELYKWAGFSNRQALTGSLISSWLFISTIELFDGFSSEYGASLQDLTANTLGASLFGLQQFFWNEQKIIYKFSYFPSDYARMRPDVLGRTHMQRLIKDYNGQTYWLSTSLQGITGIKSLPSWLNIALGYGASGMVGAADNKGMLPDNIRQRNLYLSFDINFEKIKTRNRILKTIFFAINCIKLPLPSLQFNSHETKILIK